MTKRIKPTQPQDRFAMADNSLLSSLPNPLFRPSLRGKAGRDRNAALSNGVSHDGKYLAEFEFDDEVIRLSSFHILNAMDQSILLALIRIGKQDTSIIYAAADKPERPLDDNGLPVRSDDTEVELQYRLKEMYCKLEARGQGTAYNDRIYIEASAYAILREAGLSTSDDYFARLDDILERLSLVSYTRRGKTGNKRRHASGEKLLAYSIQDDDALKVVLSERLSRAIAGEGAYSMISLSERAELQGDTAKLLHYDLSTMIRPGGTLQIRVGAKLLPRIFGDEPAKPGTQRRRKKILIDALKQIETRLNHAWRITLEKRPKYEVLATIERAKKLKTFKHETVTEGGNVEDGKNSIEAENTAV